tara:strand:+ start:2603 stop:2884 length:282 start_codon:yes stop_codon:yes gene_type:complete
MTNSLFLKAEIKEIDLWNHELASMDASTRIEWAVEKFGNGVVASTSFGLQSAVMIHLLKQASSEIPIIFVDKAICSQPLTNMLATYKSILHFR